MSEIVLTLPDGIAEEARANGLLRPEFVAALFAEELRRRKVNRLFEAAERLGEGAEPLPEDEVMAEVKAVRGERRKVGSVKRTWAIGG